jgi:hypothetical protein
MRCAMDADLDDETRRALRLGGLLAEPPDLRSHRLELADEVLVPAPDDPHVAQCRGPLGHQRGDDVGEAAAEVGDGDVGGLKRLGAVEAASQLSLALTRMAWVAGAALVLFGAHAMLWGVVTVSLRQRIVPERLRGRVNSVYFLFDFGGAALGTLLGGLLARALGITAPFWVAFAAMALLAATAWRRLTPAALAAPGG